MNVTTSRPDDTTTSEQTMERDPHEPDDVDDQVQGGQDVDPGDDTAQVPACPE